MRQTDLIEALRPTSFRPFRLHISDGRAFDIRQRERLMVGQHSVIIGIVEGAPNDNLQMSYPDIESTTSVDLIDISRIEELQGRPV
jgi:hypothetical protein